MDYKKYSILGLLLLAAGMVASCYDDKGNYDYDNLNDIEIGVTPATSSFVMGDTINIKPELKFKAGQPTDELSYEWTYDSHVISKDKDLNWIVDTVAVNKDLRLAIKDQNTGVTYFGSSAISITSPYTSEGWLILSEKEDKTSQLTYMRKSTDEDGNLKCIVTRNLYGKSNDQTALGGAPLSMNVHYVNQFDGEDNTGWVWLAQDGGLGCIDLSGSSYKQEGTLSSMFLGGSYPQGFQPKSVIDLRYLALAVGKDGTAYTRVKQTDLLYNAGNFLDTPLTRNGKNVNCDNIAMAPFDEHHGVLIYDRNSARYLHICDAIDSYTSFPSGHTVVSAIYSGKVIEPTIEERDYKMVPEFTRFDVMSDVTLHYVGAYTSASWWGKMGYMSVLEKQGKFYLQNFTENDFDIYSPDLIQANPVSEEEIPGMEKYVNGSSSNLFALCYYQDEFPGLFFTVRNALYMSYLTGKSLEPYQFAEFPSPIKSIDLNNYGNRYLCVGLENGDVYILSLNSTVLKQVVQGQPVNLSKGVDHKNVLWIEKGLGTVIQVLYKNAQNSAWGWM